VTAAFAEVRERQAIPAQVDARRHRGGAEETVRLVREAGGRDDVGHRRPDGATFMRNFAALALNLLPFRSLDGGKLPLAARLWVARQGW
jgi:hypothetical protein